MKTSPRYFSRLAILATMSLTSHLASAAIFTWSGASGTDLLWSDANNWSPTGTPGLADTAWFNNTGETNGLGTAFVNNILSASSTIQILEYTNDNTGFHNTLLNPGVTLTISNTAAVDDLFVGGLVNVATTNTISGSGATLVITNSLGRINIRNGSGTSTGPYVQNAALDLSGLDNLNAGIARLLVAGDGGSAANVSREIGTLFLAKTNVIIASGTAPAINVGDNVSNGAGGNNDPTAPANAIISYLYLGQTNAIYADTITIGREKAAGVMAFNPAFTNSGTPVVYIRGASGSRVTTFSVADQSALAASNQRDNGVVDFSGGTVDAMIATANIGLGKNGNNTYAGGASEVGTLTFSQGTINVNTLNVGSQFSAKATGTGPMGTVNVNGTGALVVNTSMVLANNLAATTPSQGTLNVNGGTVTAKGSITAGGGTSTINFNGGTLNVTNSGVVIGRLVAPISSLSFSNTTLNLTPSFFATNIVASALNVSGTANTINIAAMPAISSYPAQIPLIIYATPSGDLTTFVLGSLPTAFSIPYQGYLSNNTANLSVDLVVTNGFAGTPPPPPKSVVWNGVPSGNWDTATTNWISSGIPTNYVNVTTSGLGDTVTFDDTLAGTANVNLTTTLSPGSITVNNTLSNYVFTGSGQISGTTALTMNGAGTLTLAESGGDNFSGGIAVNNGTVIIDNDSSAIAGGTTITAGTVQVGNNDGNGVLPSGGVADNGALIFNRANNTLSVGNVISGGGTLAQNGSGTVTLVGTETYTGATTVNAGTLALTGPNGAASTISSSSGLTINNGGTVQLNSDNSLGNPTTGGLPVTINAGGTLTGVATGIDGANEGTSSHLRGLLTLNGGALAMNGTSQNLQTAHGTWDLQGGVTVNSGPNNSTTSTINCLDVIPSQTGGTVFNVTNGATASGIDLLVSGTFINGSSQADTGVILTGNGVMALDNNNAYAAGTTISGGTLQLGTAGDTNALTSPLGAAAGTVTIDSGAILKFASSQGVTVTNVIGDDGTGGALVLVSSGTNFLAGANTYNGNTLVQGGTLALSGSGSINSSTSIIVSNATLDVSASSSTVASSGSLSLTNGTLNLGVNQVTSLGSFAISNSTLIFPVNASTPNITATALATGGTTNVVNITSVPGFSSYPQQITLIKYSSADPSLVAGNNVLAKLGVKLPAIGSPVGYLTNNVDNSSVDLVLLSDTLVPIYPITWSGQTNGVNTGNWDINTTSNWVFTADGVTPYFYEDASAVTFDDTAAGTTSINLTTTVSPASITLNNSSKTYTIGGAGKISGATGLAKNGSGTLTLAETGGDNFSGGITVNGGTVIIDDNSNAIAGGTLINAGTVQVGNNDANGNLPSGTLTDNDTLVFDRSNSTLNVTSIISGGGMVENNGSGTVTLTGTETYTGPTVVNAGILAVSGPNNAVSTLSSSSGLTINHGGTLMIDSDNSLGNPTTGGGLPVTINSGGTLTGLATLNGGGGTSTHLRGLLTFNGGTLTDGGTQINTAHGTWDLDGGVTVPADGTNTSTINCLDVVPSQSGGTTFDVAVGTTPSGIDLLVSGSFINGTSEPDTGVIKSDTGTMVLDNNNTYAGGTTINGGTLQLGTAGDTNALASPLGAGAVTINNSSILKFASSRGVTVTNVIGDDGSGTVLVNSGNNIFTAANTYSGGTLVLGGTLALSGSGSINSSSVISVSNATLDLSGLSTAYAAANNIGMTNATFNLGGALATGLNSLAISNSMLVFPVNTGIPNIVAGTLTTGGTTNVINITSAAGLSVYPTNITLIKYTAAGSGLVGGNNSLATLGVKLPGGVAGYLTNDLGNSSIDLVVTASAAKLPPHITGFSLSGTNLIFSGTNGLSGGQYVLLTSTNVALPLANWTPVVTNNFDGTGNFNLTNGMAPNSTRQFYILSQ